MQYEYETTVYRFTSWKKILGILVKNIETMETKYQGRRNVKIVNKTRYPRKKLEKLMFSK